MKTLYTDWYRVARGSVGPSQNYATPLYNTPGSTPCISWGPYPNIYITPTARLTAVLPVRPEAYATSPVLPGRGLPSRVPAQCIARIVGQVYILMPEDTVGSSGPIRYKKYDYIYQIFRSGTPKNPNHNPTLPEGGEQAVDMCWCALQPGNTIPDGTGGALRRHTRGDMPRRLQRSDRITRDRITHKRYKFRLHSAMQYAGDHEV